MKCFVSRISADRWKIDIDDVEFRSEWTYQTGNYTRSQGWVNRDGNPLNPKLVDMADDRVLKEEARHQVREAAASNMRAVADTLWSEE